MSSQNTVDLGTARAEIVSYSNPSTRLDTTQADISAALPALALKIKPEFEGSFTYLKEAQGSENLEISHLSKHDDKFSRLFLNVKDDEGRLSKVSYTFLVPTSLITVAFALLLVPGSFPILLLTSTSTRMTNGMKLDGDKRVSSHLHFPPLSDARHSAIQAALSDLSDSTYASPFLPSAGILDEEAMHHFEVNDYGINQYARTAQGTLLSLLSAMTRGDEMSLHTAIELSKKLAEAYAFETSKDIDALSPEVRSNIATHNYMIEYLVSSVLHSTLREETEVPVQEMRLEPTDYTSEKSFVDIVSSLFEENEQDSPLNSAYYFAPLKDEKSNQLRDPLGHGEIPESHESIHRVLKEKLGEPAYKQVVDYTHYNWLRAEVMNTTLAGSHADLAFLSMMLLVSTRAEIFSRNAPRKNNSTYWLTSMLTGRGDSELWEINALAPALENYDTATLEALMLTNGTIGENPEGKELFFYAGLFINGIAAFLLMEEVEKDEIDTMFENLGMEGPAIQAVKTLFLDILDLAEQDFDDEDEDDMDLPEAIIPSSVINEMMTRWSAPRLSRAISMAIPVLADGFASLEGHQAGTPEWKDYRKLQIAEILFYVDDIAPGVHR